jgi:hypothetical protein
LGFEPHHLLEDPLDELVGWIRASSARNGGEDTQQQLETQGLFGMSTTPGSRRGLASPSGCGL